MAMTSAPTGISVRFLEDGGQQPQQIADELASFLADARDSLEIAIYDCALHGQLAQAVAGALNDCVRRGVAVRLAYYAGPHPARGVLPPPQPPQSFLGLVQVETKPISGYQALMHHKYVVRDAGSDAATVWTGSTNWTADAWSREENVIIQLPSQELAALYRQDFEEMWTKGSLNNTGKRDGGSASLQYNGETVSTRVWFAPGLGVDMAHAVARAVAMARKRIVLATPVLTIGSILGALNDAIAHSTAPVRGIYDRTQMDQVESQWRVDPHASWKAPAFEHIVQAANLAGKHSTPYAPGAVHDYMHAKIVVTDDTVFAGSYNFSHSGEENAENVVAFQNAALADLFAGFIDRISARYGHAGSAPPRSVGA